jgi:AraC-like DNA-binding protein
MTVGANRLPSHANTQTPTFGDVRVMLKAFERLGFDSAAMIAAAGLTSPKLAEGEGPLSPEQCERFFGEACRQRLVPNLPLRLAREVPLGSYPLLDYLVLSSATVADGIRRLCRYFSLVSEAIAFDVEEHSDAIRLVYSRGSDFAVQYSIALTVLHLRRETNQRLVPEYVTFQHPPDDPDEYAQVIGCPVRLAGWTGLALSPATWQLPMRRGDPVLCQVLEQQASSLLERHGGDDGFVRQVRRVLAGRLTSGEAEIGAVARELTITPRTLQRRLSAEGWSYRAVVEDTRRRAAAHYLSNRSLSIAEVSYLVGFSDVAAFHRAFRRWHGRTPTEFRASL